MNLKIDVHSFIIILFFLYDISGGSVAHIAVDAKSGALAVADNGCELLVYAQPRLSC